MRGFSASYWSIRGPIPRPGPLEGQTFEIEAIAELARHAPMLTRGYVTATKVLDRSRPDALREQMSTITRIPQFRSWEFPTPG